MKKVLNIAWKDLILVARDPGALALLLVTPFALTLAIAFAFGGLTGGGAGGAGLQDIPVAVANRDGGQFGRALVDLLRSEGLANLLEPAVMESAAAARAQVDGDEAAAAVIIPEGFSESILPAGLMVGDWSAAASRQQAVVEIYASPTAPISAGVVRGIVDQFLSRVAAGVVGGQVSIGQLIMTGRLAPGQAQELGQEIGTRAGQEAAETSLIAIVDESGAETAELGFDWMAYMAPSMAILGLMFTVTAGGRSILAERDDGTLPRMLVSPSSPAQVLGGKVAGIYLTGLAQLLILIAASGLILGVGWGPPLAVALLTLPLVAAATAWGLLIAALARTPGEANAVGTGITLVFAVAAGHFMPRESLPEWLRTASYISPNAWGLEGFADLVAGGGLSAVAVPIAALLSMALLLFGIAALAFRRQYR